MDPAQLTVMGTEILPATWGASHGTFPYGPLIRRAQVSMSTSSRFPAGDRQASWAGHCFIHVGSRDFGRGLEPAIVQAEWPKVILSPARFHPDAIWAVHQPLTDEQRTTGVNAALKMVGQHYDALAYAWFLAKVAKVALTNDLNPLFADTARIGPICSGTVVREQLAMGVDIGPLKTAATQDPDFVCPADCMRWGLDNNWMTSAPPSTWLIEWLR